MLELYYTCLHVMWSREISLKSNMSSFQFSIWLNCPLGVCNLLKTPPESDQWIHSYSNWKILKTIDKKMHSFFWPYISQSMLPTSIYPARSQHIIIMCDKIGSSWWNIPSMHCTRMPVNRFYERASTLVCLIVTHGD